MPPAQLAHSVEHEALNLMIVGSSPQKIIFLAPVIQLYI